MRWSLYYGNGSRYDGNCEAHALAAPNLDVQVLKQEADNSRGFTQRHGCSFYCWEDQPVPRWSGKSDLFGLQDYYGYKLGPQKVIVGREIHDDTFHTITRQVVAEGSFDEMDFRPGQLTKG